MEGTCDGCRYAKEGNCLRDGEFSQAYETKYSDKDFCGPGRRYYSKGQSVYCGDMSKLGRAL